ncbi:MAG: hypothetical protein ABIW33_07550 [Sphingomicrobium sp.]
MNRLPMSPGAAGLVRALIGRARVARDRILLTGISSVDWRSLLFNGERHLIEIRIPGPYSGEIADRMIDRLEDAEFSIPGVLVADIAIAAGPRPAPDGSTSVKIEALTLTAD